MSTAFRIMATAAAFIWVSTANGATTYVSTSLVFSPNPPVGLDVGSFVFSIGETEIRYSAYVTTATELIDILVGDALSFTADAWIDITLSGSIIALGDGLYLSQPVLRSFRLFEGVVEHQALSELLRADPEQNISVDFGAVTPATGNLAMMNVPEPSTLSLIIPLAVCRTLNRRRSRNEKTIKARRDNELPVASRRLRSDHNLLS